MVLLYAISFGAAVLGFFGVGHLFAGAPRKGVQYFIAGLLWSVLAGLVGITTGIGILCFIPLHLIFAHFCAVDAVRIAKGGDL